MHDLIAITPLGAHEPRVETHGGVTITEVVDRALASVAARLGREQTAAGLLADLIGADLPGPGRLVQGPVMAAFWTGPDQWMVEAPHDSHEDLADRIASRSGGTISVTEQTDGWCRFDLSGARLADLFERLCPADVRSFSGGEAQRTTIEHLGCFLLCRDPERISVLGPRSSAGSLHHALLTAMRSAL